MSSDASDSALRIGLCNDCRHASSITSARGSTFSLCLLHQVDPDYAKYPALPVRTCGGYESRPPAATRVVS